MIQYQRPTRIQSNYISVLDKVKPPLGASKLVIPVTQHQENNCKKENDNNTSMKIDNFFNNNYHEDSNKDENWDKIFQNFDAVFKVRIDNGQDTKQRPLLETSASISNLQWKRNLKKEFEAMNKDHSSSTPLLGNKSGNNSFVIKNLTPGSLGRLYVEVGNCKSDTSRNSSCSLNVPRNNVSDVNKSDVQLREKSSSLDRSRKIERKPNENKENVPPQNRHESVEHRKTKIPDTMRRGPSEDPEFRNKPYPLSTNIYVRKNNFTKPDRVSRLPFPEINVNMIKRPQNQSIFVNHNHVSKLDSKLNMIFGGKPTKLISTKQVSTMNNSKIPRADFFKIK